MPCRHSRVDGFKILARVLGVHYTDVALSSVDDCENQIVRLTRVKVARRGQRLALSLLASIMWRWVQTSLGRVCQHWFLAMEADKAQKRLKKQKKSAAKVQEALDQAQAEALKARKEAKGRLRVALLMLYYMDTPGASRISCSSANRFHDLIFSLMMTIAAFTCKH